MPRELIAVAPRQPLIREYEEPPLPPQQVRIRSEFSAPKHGTELGASSCRGKNIFHSGSHLRVEKGEVPR